MSRRNDNQCDKCGVKPATKIVSITDMECVLEEQENLCAECIKPILREIGWTL